LDQAGRGEPRSLVTGPARPAPVRAGKKV